MIIHYTTDTAAFEDAPISETQCVFADLLNVVDFRGSDGIIRDTNGNTIGAWSTEPLPILDLLQSMSSFRGTDNAGFTVTAGELRQLAKMMGIR